MACRQLIQFPAIYRDGELLTCATNVGIDCGNVKILGEKTEKAWDAVKEKFMCVTGFFISFKGIEYGSIDINMSDYFALCRNACNDGGATQLRIFDIYYDIEFE